MVLATRVEGSGRPVVLLPWFGLAGAVMAEAFEPVFGDAAGWRRIYVDLPGTGGSPRTAPSSDAVLAAVLDTAAALVGDEPFAVAGCSYGGYLAAGCARRRPGRVAGLLGVCAGVRIRPADRDLSGVGGSVGEPGWLDGVPASLREHFAHAVGRQTRAVAARVAGAVALGGPVDEEFLEALRATGYRLSDEERADRYDGPVLMLAGRRDRVAGYRDQFEVLARYPAGGYATLADAGHYLPFERPVRFVSVVRGWLADMAQAWPGR